MVEIYNEDIGFGVTKFPDKKRDCLYVRKGNKYYPVAYFTSDSNKNYFIDVLITVLGSLLKKED